MLKKIFSCVWSNILLGFIPVLFSIYLSFNDSEWEWFSRSGSILTIFGIILSARPIIRMGIKGFIEYNSIIDGGTASPSLQDIEDERQKYLDVKSNKIGIFMAIAGTIIWAYGDLIGKFFR